MKKDYSKLLDRLSVDELQEVIKIASAKRNEKIMQPSHSRSIVSMADRTISKLVQIIKVIDNGDSKGRQVSDYAKNQFNTMITNIGLDIESLRRLSEKEPQWHNLRRSYHLLKENKNKQKK